MRILPGRSAVRRWWETVRTRAIVASIVLVLMVTTYYLVWFGLADFMEALAFSGRITGAVLVAVGVGTFLGALAVFDYQFTRCFPNAGLIALIGTVAAFVTNLMLALAVIQDGDSTLYKVLWSLLTAGSAWAAVMVWRTRVEIPTPKRVAAAVVVPSVLALANFGYQHLYQPFQHGARPLITITTGKAMVSQDRKRFAVPVEIKLENHSDVGFYVLGAEFHAMGEKVPLSPKDRLQNQWRADSERHRPFRERSALSRREIHDAGELVKAEPWLDPGDWIEANDSFCMRTVVQLPMNTKYDDLAFYATASFGRKDRLALDHFNNAGYSWKKGKAPSWARSAGSDTVIFRARVHENNAIDKHTRDHRYMTVYWQFGQHGAGVLPAVTRKGEEGRTGSVAESNEVVSRYGIVDADAGPMEQTLWEIKSLR
ncbi:hypothetical protein [Streptomyces collinus]|uniref:hypothetical protein n=1 Tax=Streptomyces collinus TaxID=42684 RepID=UPI003331FE75